ncbi:aldolase/citrate lyase family protein [Amycolatopsis acidiphila]|uniref:2,4-dihydroxyhept-2-ene-1,7-dioic acid aldolase n=1 Tax=Amycolatopsis acidiphila TaxID=715473 RepID=A0A558ACD3_9PSEU|nr:aldolase/citrate lyase family protein [Amycolatopsis acidiphila]TVT21930.1 2,4-dihydroxyhept-2-ene-1,7-dioic acid aldolase [Amycolatopsis acidiphila]UIJ57354.1 aldolase/citrate lyase family protein [Amycolatopsis acidiphila]GHG84640.1 2,4-dihydroxyhept-2-ene-1,7-dioic acid aldolase [Amycolatopsis acidiphila]
MSAPRRTGAGLFAPDRATTPVGTWLKIASGEPVEIMAYAGFDFVVVDLEHAPLDLQTAYRLINSAAALGMVPLVRVPDKTPSTIQKILDAGAMGILVPHVDTVEQAAAVGQACRFPPHGVRGAGGTSRAGAWGLRPNAEYLTTGNDDVLCIAQLESVEAIKAAPEMLALDSVDAVFVGAADLSMAMGSTPASPEVLDLIGSATAAAHAVGKRCGLAFGGVPERAAQAVRDGCDFLLLSNDTSMLAEAARGLVTAFRAAAEEEN